MQLIGKEFYKALRRPIAASAASTVKSTRLIAAHKGFAVFRSLPLHEVLEANSHATQRRGSGSRYRLCGSGGACDVGAGQLSDSERKCHGLLRRSLVVDERQQSRGRDVGRQKHREPSVIA